MNSSILVANSKTLKTVDRNEYLLAMANNITTECLVGSVIRGGYLYNNLFYFVGRVTDGYQCVQLRETKTNE